MEDAHPADKENQVLTLIVLGSLMITLVISVITATVLDKFNVRKKAI